jgi:hypothetical protein
MEEARRRLTGVVVEVAESRQLLPPNAFRVRASREVVVKEVRFADDMVGVGSGPEELRQGIEAIVEEGNRVGLKLSVKKTKVLVLGAEAPAEFVLGDGTKLEVVKSFTYLGSGIEDSGGGAQGDVKRRLDMAAGAFNELKKGLWSRKEVSIKTKLAVFNSVVVNRLLYAAETWPLTAADLRRLDSFHTYCLRRILRVSYLDKLRNEEVRSRCKQPTLEEMVRERRLRWLGHVQRMGDDRLPKAMLWGRWKDAQRPQGGHRKRWKDLCQADVAAIADWKGLCMDRNRWRAAIKAKGCATAAEKRRYERKGGGSVEEGLEAGGDLGRVSTAEELTRPARRYRVAERDVFGFECDGCGRRFRRQGDQQRHVCKGASAVAPRRVPRAVAGGAVAAQPVVAQAVAGAGRVQDGSRAGVVRRGNGLRTDVGGPLAAPTAAAVAVVPSGGSVDEGRRRSARIAGGAGGTRPSLTTSSTATTQCSMTRT